MIINVMELLNVDYYIENSSYIQFYKFGFGNKNYKFELKKFTIFKPGAMFDQSTS